MNKNTHFPPSNQCWILSAFHFCKSNEQKKAILIFYRFVFLWFLVNLSMLSYIYWSFIFCLWIACLYYLPISLLDCCLFLLIWRLVSLHYDINSFSVTYVTSIFFPSLLLVSIYIVLHQKVFLCSKICQSFLLWPQGLFLFRTVFLLPEDYIIIFLFNIFIVLLSKLRHLMKLI